jgi:hypothetical protein
MDATLLGFNVSSQTFYRAVIGPVSQKPAIVFFFFFNKKEMRKTNTPQLHKKKSK